MSKLSKLAKSPGVFFRDMLLKKYPLSINQRVPTKVTTEVNWDAIDRRTAICTDRLLSFPIDVVITYVDGSDLSFQQLLVDSLKKEPGVERVSLDSARFEYHDEIKYGLRSILKYAPWVNKIYLVSAGQVPDWFNFDQDKVVLVNHADIIDPEYLPTFNSHVIESAIHKIPNLSEHYLYFNDDMFLARPVLPEYFFGANGLAYLFQSQVLLQNSPATKIYDTPTEWGAKNARALIFMKFGIYVNEMFAHTLYPQRKSVAQFCEESFSNVFEDFRKNRFREVNDLLCTGFLFPHVTNILGKGLYTRMRVSYFNIRMPSSRQNYHWLASVKGTAKAPFSFCANDRSERDARQDYDYKSRFFEFMNFYFPEKCLAEI